MKFLKILMPLLMSAMLAVGQTIYEEDFSNSYNIYPYTGSPSLDGNIISAQWENDRDARFSAYNEDGSIFGIGYPLQNELSRLTLTLTIHPEHLLSVKSIVLDCKLISQDTGSYLVTINDQVFGIGSLSPDATANSRGKFQNIVIPLNSSEFTPWGGVVTIGFDLRGNVGDLLVFNGAKIDGVLIYDDKNYATGSKVNYVREAILQAPVTDKNALPLTNISKEHWVTNYFDGLGRQIQTVERATAATESDLYSSNVYDPFGRQLTRNLPAAYSNDGKFKRDALNVQYNQYDDLFPEEQQTGYLKVEYDDATLARTIFEYSPGKRSIIDGVKITRSIRANTSLDDVRIWTSPTNSTEPALNGGTWPDGYLEVTQKKDEQNNVVLEYRDKDGKLILAKRQIDPLATTGHTGWLCTYFVYDIYNRLTQVLSPKAVEAIMANSWVITGDVFANLCYAYSYDNLDRVIVKKLPGQAARSFVYDVNDQIILTQDGKLASEGAWMFTKNDALGREIVSGKFLNSSALSRNTIQSQIISGPTNSFLGFLINPIYQNTYTTASSIADAEIYSLKYYDSYVNIPTGFTYQAPAVNNLDPGELGVSPMLTKETMGLPIASCTRTMDGTTVGNAWETTVNFYDYKGNILQTQTKNTKGGNDIISFRYDFRDKLISSLSSVNNPSDNNFPTIQVLKNYQYDASGRTKAIYQKINNEPYYRQLCEIQYDPFSRVINEKIGTLESRDYHYNIWGGLESINKDFINDPSIDKYFGEQLHYTTSEFGYSNDKGMPTDMQWRLRGSRDVLRGYAYDYDPVNRLTKAAYSQKKAGGSWSSLLENYTANNISYDANGNLLSMKQWGTSAAYPAPFLMDQLGYQYMNDGKSNQLKAVNDQVTTNYNLGEFNELSGTTATDYAYDQNGNAVSDANKNISSISYSYLNKPFQITFNNNREIKFKYDASGTKVAKEIYENNLLTKGYDYLGGLEYTNNSLSSIPNEYGTVRPITIRYPNLTTSSYFEYDFHFKDHQGNVRSVATLKPEQNWFTPTIAGGYIQGFNLTSYNPQSSGAIGFTASERNYTATNEIAAASVEEAFFDNVDVTRDTKMPTSSPGDEKATRLNASQTNRKVGPAILLRIMSGDKIQVGVQSYFSTTGADYSGTSPLDQQIAMVIAGLAGGGSGASGTSEGILNNLVGQSTNGYWATALSQLQTTNPVDPNAPKAFLNYIYLDDNLQIVPENSKILQATTPNNWSNLQGTEINSTQTGYLLVYVNNTSAIDVYFDNLNIIHKKGELLQESHYYPYGLTISTPAYANVNPNNYLYLGAQLHKKEFTNGSGLDWYELGSRQYDPQIGRWHSADPLQEKAPNWSPYRYGFSNPVVFTDPSGLDEFGDDVTDDRFPQNYVNEYSDGDYTYYSSNIGFSFFREDGTEVFGYEKTEHTFYTPDIANEFDLSYWGGTGGTGGETSVGNGPNSFWNNLKIHFVFETVTPEIYNHTIKAIAEHPEWKILTYNGGGKSRDINRSNALRGIKPAGSGRSLDEFPYASTMEGGFGAKVFAAPVAEQGIQAVQLSVLYGRGVNRMKAGDKFLVFPVSKIRELQPVPMPKRKEKPWQFPIIPSWIPSLFPKLVPVRVPIVPIIMPLIDPESRPGDYFGDDNGA